MSQQTFKVSGLHCHSCVRVVSTTLGALPTVTAVEVDLGTDGPSTVRVDAGGVLTVEQVQAALSEEGEFSVVG